MADGGGALVWEAPGSSLRARQSNWLSLSLCSSAILRTSECFFATRHCYSEGSIIPLLLEEEEE